MIYPNQSTGVTALTVNHDLAKIYEQAADWAEKTGQLTSNDLQQLTLWRAEDPLHDKAYQKCLTLWESETMTSALSAIEQPKATPIIPTRRSWRLIMSSALLLAFVSLSSWQWLATPTPTATAFVTHAAQQTSHHLPDGSRFTLAGNSDLDFKQTSNLRQITLHQGEALFEVSHLGPEQPFVVDSGDTRVTVTGTRFSVEKMPLGTEVTVLEGSVLVSLAQQQVALTAGQRVTVQQQQISTPQTLWPGYSHYLDDIWLDVREETLDNVLRKLERQLPDGIMLTDPTLADLKITGRFDISHAENALYLLAAASQLQVRHSGGRYIIYRL